MVPLFCNLTPYKYHNPSYFLSDFSLSVNSLPTVFHFLLLVFFSVLLHLIHTPKKNKSKAIFLCSVFSMASASNMESATAPPPLYFDEKWKLSKKEGSSRSRCSSTRTHFIKSSTTQRRCAFARKCARLVKEQRARFYIMRRCVTMLICWREYSDSWRKKCWWGKTKKGSWFLRELKSSLFFVEFPLFFFFFLFQLHGGSFWWFSHLRDGGQFELFPVINQKRKRYTCT